MPKAVQKINLSTLKHANPTQFSLPYCDLIGDKLNEFSRFESVLPVLVITEWSLPALILIHESFVIFSFAIPLRRGDLEWLGGHLASSQGQSTIAIQTQLKEQCQMALIFFYLFLISGSYGVFLKKIIYIFFWTENWD